MIELTLLEYLKKELSYPVHMERQNDQTNYIVIEKTGGSCEDFIARATFAVQTYGESLYKAALMANEVFDVMLKMPDYTDVSSCKVNGGPYNYTDTETKEYRYQTVYDIHYHS